MAGFTSPSILFLNTWDGPEREYNYRLLSAARQNGYDKLVELYAGGFANPIVAIEAGWKPEQITTVDVWLYTAILGYLYSGRPLHELGMKVDGKPIPLDGTPVQQAARMILAQYQARLEKTAHIEYIDELLNDVTLDNSHQMDYLCGKLTANCQRLNGINHIVTDSSTYLDSILDEPHTLIMANPPTYCGAYEKFFDTGGRITWNEPDYHVFDAPTDIPRILHKTEAHKSLFVVQQQQTPGNSASPHPVYARRLGLDSVIYLNSNQPEKVKQLTGGLRITRKPGKTTQLPVPLLPETHQLTEHTRVQLIPLTDATIQSAYLQIFRHRLSTQPSPQALLVTLDGYAAGIIGYSTPTPYSGITALFAVLRQAFGIDHGPYRLTKLITMLSLQKNVFLMTTTPKIQLRADSTTTLTTTEYTRYHEAKGLRGLMKLVKREKKKGIYQLTYNSPWKPSQTIDQIYVDWWNREQKRLEK